MAPQWRRDRKIFLAVEEAFREIGRFPVLIVGLASSVESHTCCFELLFAPVQCHVLSHLLGLGRIRTVRQAWKRHKEKKRVIDGSWFGAEEQAAKLSRQSASPQLAAARPMVPV